MTTTLEPTHDWRDDIPGLVRLPEDHEYGKTALTQQEWRKLAHRYEGQRFTVVFDGPQMRWPVRAPFKRWDAAMGDFRSGLMYGASSYHPHSGMRLSVISEQTLRQSITDGAAK